ncbi:tribbles homolog 2-like [Alosa alosa]|uniref:tribbles homolog 2-like n=1 Tax=Alosa alosa TaxID=278164 RepID=UPI00201507B8|nr:tribbles homolog 2-like [Alosa alosa]
MGHAKYVVETFKNTKLPCMGKYVLLDCLGNNILRAANMDTGKKLICKVFYFARYWESLAAYFQVPAHRNLSQIIDTVHGDTMVYVFFEHNYGDLHSCLRSVKKIREDEAARLFHQMVSAVVHCHDYGVVLKDLKLKSFVFKDEDRSYLKLDTLEDAYLMVQGDNSLPRRHRCPAYISPESLESESTSSGKAADVWCLGVILYTILIGHYPFNDTDHSSLFQKIKRCKYSLPDILSPKAKCLIHNILRPDPVERLTAREILGHPWFSSNNWTGNIAGDKSDKECCDQMVPNLFC